MRQSHHKAAEKGQMAGATSRVLPMITAGEPVPADINHTLSLQRAACVPASRPALRCRVKADVAAGSMPSAI